MPQRRTLSPTADELFAEFPRERLAAYLRPIVGRMIRDMIAEIQTGVPAYSKPLEGKFGQVLITGVEQAVRQVVDNLGKPGPVDKQVWQDWFHHAGRIEFLEGRTMDALQSAVRIGTRVAWRNVQEAGKALNVPTDSLFKFADALFAYSDELCGLAFEGYTQAQAEASGTIERRRQQLLKLLVSSAPASRQTIADLAAATNWPMPEQVAVIALQYSDEQFGQPLRDLPRDVLVDEESTEPCMLLPAPEDEAALPAKALSGRRAALGPSVPLAEAHRSFSSAQRALALAARGILPGEDLIVCAEHLTTLALCADEFVLGHLTERALRPLAPLTDKQRERLSATLLAWLSTRGGVNEIAARLSVHPQTVRYRMNQVNDLFGEQLADPDQRLMLEIALRASGFLSGCEPAELTPAAPKNP
ncbi:MAG: PucR family transcriptional regulator [Thermocrispum sp.]